MRRLGFLLLIVVLAFAAGPSGSQTLDTLASVQNSPLVVTPPAVKVNPQSGSAVYSYSIQIPPGTGGHAPALALVYNSLAKHSAYGFGWSLRGCPRTCDLKV